MPLKTPDFMPSTPADRTADSVEVLDYRDVPGVSFHRDNDGIIEYYDQPLIFVAWYQDQMVVATLTDEDYEGPPEQAKGWNQKFLIGVTPEFLMQVYNGELPLRALYDQPGAKTWFIHEDWQYKGNQTWDRQIQVFDDVPFPDDAKPKAGVFQDSDKSEEEAASPPGP